MLVQEALDACAALNDRVYMSNGLVTLAYTAAQLGQPVRSARLLGAAESQCAAIGSVLPSHSQTSYDLALRKTREQLAPGMVEKALAAGRRMTLQDALKEARLNARPAARHQFTAAPESSPEALTDRECNVVALVANGLSDQQIAGQLGISVRTVNAHVRNVLAKLNLHSRWQVRDWALASGLVCDR